MKMNSMPQKILLKFSQRDGKGLTEVFYGKGSFFCLTSTFMVILFLSIFFFLIPLKITLPLCLFRLFILSAGFFICYLFSKAVIEISIEEDKLNIKTFKRYKRYLIGSIQLINAYYFTSWGLAMIYLQYNYKSNRYFFWAPPFDKERNEMFFKFLDSLREVSTGKFQLNFKD